MKAPTPPGLIQTGRSGAFIFSGCFSLVVFINNLMLLRAHLSGLVAVMLSHGEFTHVFHVHPCLEVLTPTRQACVLGMLFSCVLMCLLFCCHHALPMCLHMSCPCLEICTPARQACVPGMLFSCVLMCLLSLPSHLTHVFTYVMPYSCSLMRGL